MPGPDRDLPNLYIEGGAKRESFTPIGGGRRKPPPERDRAQHAAALQDELDSAFRAARQLIAVEQAELDEDERGFYLEVRLPPDAHPALEKLEDRRHRFELVAAREEAGDQGLVATLFLPEKRAEAMSRKVAAYAEAETKSGRPRHEDLVARMGGVRVAELRSIFTDPPDLFPQTGQQMWWEVWLRSDRRAVFQQVVARMDLPSRDHPLSFPERDVVLVRGNPDQLSTAMVRSGAIAEVRKAKDSPAVFLEMPIREQVAWIEDLAERLDGPPPDDISVCLLDTGVVGEHPLLQPAITSADQHSYDAAWGVDDRDGHGTGMAGLVLHGDLVDVLGGNRRIAFTHRLESVKILPNGGANDPRLYGRITIDGVSQAEIQAPDRTRVVCLAVTSDGEPGHGQPSSWSAAVDQLSFGEPEWRRLIVIAAGNIRDRIAAAEYPDRNDIEPIEDPAQAWNALTVGAYTEKCDLLDPDVAHLRVVAQPGGLCPTSRIAVPWSHAWPNKPDVVMEGGNLYADGPETSGHDDLSLLTTDRHVPLRMLAPFGDTSAAAALVARMAAQINSSKRGLWPETVRGLIVHSAEWTETMRASLGPTPSSNDRRNLLRRFGFGVPDLRRAIASASNDVNLVVQERIRPYEEGAGSRLRSKDIHLHRLPWPETLLLDLGEAPVEMRVTLSYFIEPNPGERGWTKRHQYPSHGLRFDVKRIFESEDQFRGRLNQEAREDDYEGAQVAEADTWFLGTRLRHTGSVHSDVWTGIAADLAQLDSIAVYPIGGWWKENKSMDRWQQEVPYSLIVSIRAPDLDVDLYTPIEAAIKTPVDVTV